MSSIKFGQITYVASLRKLWPHLILNHKKWIYITIAIMLKTCIYFNIIYLILQAYI